jgi:cysteinyl-tRNA synthetase
LAAEQAVKDVEAALFDDLNGPEALAGLFTFIHRANAELDKRGSDVDALEAARAAFGRINSVLDIVPERTVDDPELASWVEERLAARKAARERRDFAEADRVRGELTGRGIVIEDTPAGTKWKRLR